MSNRKFDSYSFEKGFSLFTQIFRKNVKRQGYKSIYQAEVDELTHEKKIKKKWNGMRNIKIFNGIMPFFILNYFLDAEKEK